jgi:hypothetical protein
MDMLVDMVEESDIVFIRRGSKYDGKAAADHIRDKMRGTGEERLSKATAQEFIDELASVSWGIFLNEKKPYHVELPDGTVITAKEWLDARLEEIEAAHPDAPAPPAGDASAPAQ